MKPASRKESIVWIQVLVWTFIALIVFALFFHEGQSLVEGLIRSLCYTAFFALLMYTNTLALVPYVYRRKQTLLYVFLVVLLLAVVTVGEILSELGMQRYLFGKKAESLSQVKPRVYMALFFLNLLVYLFSLPLRLAFDYFTMRKQQEQLLRRTAEAELNLLKAQVQPHFLFNTLNNIYFVAQRESPATATLLERLSNIMRYFVDEGPKEKIQLDREIDFIKDYIHLEKLRMRHPLQTEFNVEGETANVTIPPMLLIPLVENVFKHGVNKRSEDNLLIIQLKVERNNMDIEVTNRLFEELEPASHGGNGLPNLRSRLQLLYGPAHTLETEQHDGLFTAHLNIPLS